ncbi:pectinesterase inhibitor 10-like [Solanum dulcamara]|uniref:pectinesterase inhibitor 10-like n=1 Tax=Solanum dulcamara TaxID=45834 RepID=UPI0024863C94|nr:pectinesterase inhibitor 10-like [Solanum dulcamara]
MKEITRNRKTEQNITYSCSAVCHHTSATPTTTTTATVAVFSGENCSMMNSSTVSLKRKSLSPKSSPCEPSPKRITLNSPPPSTNAATAIASAEDGPASISPITSPSPKRVTLNSPPPFSTAATSIAAAEDGPASISPITSPSPKRVIHNSPHSSSTTIAAAVEGGPASISPITSLSPAFSPFSKRGSEKSPFATTNATTADAAAPPLPFSRFTKTQHPNNNKILRRTLSEPPIFDSFTDFCRYINSQSPENVKNNSISIKSSLRRSISDPTAAAIILAPAPAPAAAIPALTSGTEHEETTRIKSSCRVSDV